MSTSGEERSVPRILRTGEPGPLEVVGLGSMVLDRMHRTRRVLGANEKGLLEPIDDAGGGPVQTCIGGVLLNQLGWASLFGIRAGLFGRQGDDEAGRVLRAAMKAAGLATHLDLTGSASSIAEIFVDGEGERVIYMAAGATAETTPTQVRGDHANFVARGRWLSTEVSQLPLDTTLEALRLAHEHGLDTVVDLDILPSDATGVLGSRDDLDAILGEADLLKPTALAARELLPDATTLEEIVAGLRARYGCREVVLTDGDRGALLCDEEGTRWIAAHSVETVSDSTGAG